MPRAYCPEVLAIEGDDTVRAQALCECHDRGVGAAQREVGISLYQLGDTRIVLMRRGFDVERAESAEERASALAPSRVPIR